MQFAGVIEVPILQPAVWKRNPHGTAPRMLAGLPPLAITQVSSGWRTNQDTSKGIEMAGWLLTTGAVAVARPALRLGGEWAGWSCGFDPYNGALRTQSETLGTERWEGNALQRRCLQLGPACESSGDDTVFRVVVPHSNDWYTLPVAVCGATSLMAGARAGLFGEIQLDMLNAEAWALDEAISRREDRRLPRLATHA